VSSKLIKWEHVKFADALTKKIISRRPHDKQTNLNPPHSKLYKEMKQDPTRNSKATWINYIMEIMERIKRIKRI